MTDEEFISAVKRNSQRLFLIALSFTKNTDSSEDLLQNVFLKLWQYSKLFKNTEHMDKWLTAVCVNECRNFIKSPFRKHHADLNEFTEAEKFDSTEYYDIFNAVMSLPEKERTVVHLFYYEDLPVREIARLLKQSESSAKTRLYRARKKLKEKLGDEWINE